MQNEVHQSAVSTPEVIAARLVAAKPARWIGRGELISLPWIPPVQGPVLLIDLWSGYSGAAIALLSLGIKCYILAAESNQEVVRMAEASIDQIVHVSRVESVTALMLKGIVERRKIQCIMVGGGSPCQGNTSLNKGRKGLADPRSQQPNELVRIKAELRAAYPDIPTLTFLENVASAPKPVKEEYDRLMGVKPIYINSGIFGWVDRKRFYWASGSKDEDVAWHHRALPANVTMTWEGDRSVIHYEGKPIPRDIRIYNGFKWKKEKPEVVVKEGGRGAMFPFTREFEHPDERVSEAWEVVERWNHDGKRFPVGAYTEKNLLWRGQEWRTLNSSERAQAHGCPPSAVRPDYTESMRASEAERMANCAIGNGFHIPSVMLVFMLLLQSVAAYPAPTARLSSDRYEQELSRRVRGTVFDDYALRSTPGLLSSDQCVDQMALIFEELNAEEKMTARLPWRTIRQRLRGQEAGVLALQRYWAHEVWRGRDDGPMGPRPRTAQERAQAWAYLGMQRAAGNSHRGLDHLLKPGLGREEHMRSATLLPSPFKPGTITDPDLQFAAYTMAVWGPHISPDRKSTRLNSSHSSVSRMPSSA